ncbi:MAG: 2-oxoacid:acceptor oxidoreductase family protein [Deltaproteobacteria bacterium]|jgi:2-oxoglutarate ferredoxin oxidoreductase subunit gamma|nr:2-oxoacid:acceptor oxidoreductase family protein [Deltaproteobacteria bacterium]
MERSRFLLSGSGGQGVITMGILLAETAALQAGLNAIQSQSYGPEARGGATRCDVLISNTPILYPKVQQANVMVCLTQEALNRYLQYLIPGGLLVTDAHFVKTPKRIDAEHYALPMHDKVMETIGKAQVFNICVLGALVQLSGVVASSAIEKNLSERFAPAFHENNKKALSLGMEMAKSATGHC